ncbi:MAG: ribosome silencing factor [Anaerolineales bacterium]|nr:ribosome silencing factor [Anaerolineae bacterium]PWB52424.1 MAG: ribosome silencing factor [Anaerolineales bacterium]
MVNQLEEKKGENLVLIDIKNLAVFADYFIICSGTSDRMIGALASSVSEFIHTKYQLPVHTEGEPREGWVLIDAGEIIIHVFSPEQRNYYKLEDLWSHGKVLLHLQ